MAVFNYLTLDLICPRCGITSEMEAEFRFGLRELIHYRIGDSLRWDGAGVKTPESRPENGNYIGEAYAVCPKCERDFWLTVTIKDDLIFSAVVDPTRAPYIPDNETQPAAIDPQEQQVWDPAAHAEIMKTRVSPPVSAFFLIDSPEAIQKCIQWLSILQRYGMPDLSDSQYFRDVLEIFNSGRQIINFDYDFPLVWQGKEIMEKLRCHSVDRGRYEIELWLPGVLANEIADHFSDGRSGFFCAFMTHCVL